MTNSPVQQPPTRVFKATAVAFFLIAVVLAPRWSLTRLRTLIKYAQHARRMRLIREKFVKAL